MLYLLFGSIDGYSTFQWIIEIVCDILILTLFVLIFYLNYTGIKSSKAQFIKDSWTDQDLFNKILLFLLQLPAWIVQYIRYRSSKKQILIKEFATKSKR